MNTNQKGKLTELKMLTYIIELGYSVSIPFGDKDRYDQIWDINGKLLKIQIKTAHWKNSEKKAIVIKTRSISNGKQVRYTKDQIDYFATCWNEKYYLIPVEECSTEKTLWLETPKANFSNCSFAKDYEIKEILKKL